jgi:hypothetical protein
MLMEKWVKANQSESKRIKPTGILTNFKLFEAFFRVAAAGLAPQLRRDSSDSSDGLIHSLQLVRPSRACHVRGGGPGKYGVRRRWIKVN